MLHSRNVIARPRPAIGAGAQPGEGQQAPGGVPESLSFEAWVTILLPAESDSIVAATTSQGQALKLEATLPRHARLSRGLLILLTSILPFLLLVGGPTVWQWLKAGAGSSHAAHARSVADAPWLATGRGNGATGAARVDIQPASTDGDVAYTCWVSARPGASGLAALQLAATTDGARTWRALPPPLARADACSLTTDSFDPWRVVLQVRSSSDDDCAALHMFTTADAGTHWSALALPAAFSGDCALSLVSTNGTLYLWSKGTPTVTKTMSSTMTGLAADAQIWTSLDTGVTWRPITTDLPAGTIENLVAAQADGALLVLLSRSATDSPEGSSARHELWACLAGCRGWQWVADVPGQAPTVYAALSDGAALNMGWGTLYDVDGALSPSRSDMDNARELVYVSAGAPGASWHPLSTVFQGTADRVVGIGPEGLLMMEMHSAAALSEASSSTTSLVGALCAWNPASDQWMAPCLIEPSNNSLLAVVWDEQNPGAAPRLTFWLINSSGDLWQTTLSANDWWSHSSVGRCKPCR